MIEAEARDARSDAVLEVLRDVIGNNSISPTDDFYLAGGHSLLVVKVVQRLRKQHGLELNPRQFSVNTLVAALIAACKPVDAGATDQEFTRAGQSAEESARP